MGNQWIKPNILNAGADRFYDQFAHSFQALKSDNEEYNDILRVLSTQLQYVPPDQETFHLSINGRAIGLALLAIANALMGDEHVAQLSLETTGIDAATVSILAPVLTVNHTLKELYMNGNNIGPQGVRVLARALRGNRTLVSLHVARTACGDEGAAWLADLMQSGESGLRRLDVSGNGISEVGVSVLLEACRTNENVVEIQLRDNGVADEVLAPLQELCKARFKPYMDQIKREEELAAFLRKSDIGRNDSLGKKKKGFSSIKSRLKTGKVRSTHNMSAVSMHPSDSTPTVGSVGDNEHSLFDLLRNGEPEAPMTGPMPRPKRGDLDTPGSTKQTKSRSAPNSPRGQNDRVRVLLDDDDEDSSDRESKEEALPNQEQILRLHIIEAARLKPVQKNGFSDPYCHSDMKDARGNVVKTKPQRKTLSPHWDQWFDLRFDSLSDWAFELFVQDDKVTGEKGCMGRIVMQAKEWDLSEEKGQERWVDIVDGLGAVKVCMQATSASLPAMKALAAQRREAAAREKEAKEQAAEPRGGRPRGRTMLAPPKLVSVAPGSTAAGAAAGAEKPVNKIPTSSSLQMRIGSAETIGRRPTMEDAMLIQGNLGGKSDRDLYAIFDGHGSEKVAVHCAERLGAVLLGHLDAGKPPLEALRQSFLDLSVEVAPFAINMGCTVVAALVEGKMIHCANCGDARAVLCSVGGVAERLTVDHKPSLPEETKRIEDLGGIVKNGRVQGQLAVSRALGDSNFAPFISPEPYLRSVAITEENTHLILACDGLWDVFPDSLASQIVVNQPDPSQGAAMLRDRAFASGSTDNISVMVGTFRPPSTTPEKKDTARTRKSPAASTSTDDPFKAFGHYATEAPKPTQKSPQIPKLNLSTNK